MNIKIQCKCGEIINRLGLNFIDTEVQRAYYKDLSYPSLVRDNLVYKSQKCPYCVDR